MELLIIIAILLVIIAAAKVLKTKELVDDLKDTEADPISPAENKTNAAGMLVYGIVFFALVIAQIVAWDKYLLPSSASVEGEATDQLMAVTLWLILGVFFITQGLLFWFIFKYHYKKGKKAFWFPHNNGLEIAWTVVPAIVLIMLVTYGMSTWSSLMNAETQKEAIQMEFLSKQFEWITRFGGDDNKLGKASFTLYENNKSGIATKSSIDSGLVYSENKIKELEPKIKTTDSLVELGWNRGDELCKLETSLKNYKANVRRLKKLQKMYAENAEPFDNGKDDKIINSLEIKLPKGRQVVMNLRSMDVIHSAYLPHFRAQMNTVPGDATQFKFTPKYTTEEYNELAKAEGKVWHKVKRDKNDQVIEREEVPGFSGYWLVCNKICGSSHYNMKVSIDVVEPAEFDAWLAQQTAFEKK